VLGGVAIMILVTYSGIYIMRLFNTDFLEYI